MTLNEIKKKYATAAQAKVDRASAVDDLKKELEKVTADKLAAADRGDLDAYKALEARGRELDAEIFVETRSMNALDRPVPVEEIEKAWHEYAKSYSAKARKSYADYLKACRVLFKLYKDMLDNQRRALTTRAEAAEMAGETPQAFDMFMLPTGNRPGLNNRSFWNFPELEFAYKMGCVSDREAHDYIFLLNGSASALGVGAPHFSEDNLNWPNEYI